MVNDEQNLQQVDAQEEELARLKGEIEQLKFELTESREQLARQEAAIEEAKKAFDQLIRKYRNLYASNSWKVTRPLRWLSGLVTKKGKEQVTVEELVNQVALIKGLEQLPVFDRQRPGKVGQLRTKLLTLGFEEKASEDLAELATSSQVVLERLWAAWELAVFYANQANPEAASKALFWSEKLWQFSELWDADLDKLAILQAEAYELLGQPEPAKKLIEERLAKSSTPDLLLIKSHFEEDFQAKLDVFNDLFTQNHLARVRLDTGAQDKKPYDRLSSEPVTLDYPLAADYKVTVIIPAYEAEETLLTTLQSLQEQTWKNLEVFVVDDCSPDQTFALASDFIAADPRFQLLQTPVNSGPYVARNLALQKATGDFITINDADDWSHPQKIEVQARHLIENPSIIANMSNQARMTEGFKFYRRGNPGFFIQPNMSSLMFRRKEVVEAIGYWDSVRFAADSEFTQRLQRHFGKSAIAKLQTPPLSFQRQTEGSLTGSSSFGYHGFKMGARKAYEDAHKAFHKKYGKKAYVGFPVEVRPFPAPLPMLPEAKRLPETHYDVILVSDFRLPGGTSMSNAEEIKAQAAMGLKTGLVQMSRYDMNAGREMNPIFKELINEGGCDLLVYGQELTCDLLVLRLPWVLEEKQRYLPSISAKAIRVIVNQPPKRDYGKDSEYIYHLPRCAQHLEEYFGQPATWHPIGPLVREALVKHHADELDAITLSADDWPNIINTTEWQRAIQPEKSDVIRICRHSRDQYVKWPATAQDLLAAYPESPEFEIHVMGGAETPKEILGGQLPANWRVTGFGKVDPKVYLADFDVFVYFTHPDWVESFGRVIFEAMAVGLPVILPPQYQPVFKEAAIYCEPEEVASRVKELMASTEAYQEQVERSLNYVRKHYSYPVHAQRLEKSGVKLALQPLLESVFGKTSKDLDANWHAYTSLDLEAAKQLKLKAEEDQQAASLLAQLQKLAQEAMGRGPYSVTDKTSLPPSGNLHDYWHPAPYWWPNPNKADGLPYVRRDGERVPGTEMYDPQSDKYDRTRVQRLFDDSWVLMLAWQLGGDAAFAKKAAKHLVTFFLDPETRMNPHLNFAQVKMGHNNNQGSPTGIIEFKDFYYYLDAVRLMVEGEFLSQQEVEGFKDWLRTYMQWLIKSPQGVKESKAKNNHGTYYDLQVAAIASFLGEELLTLKVLQNSVRRINHQFTPEGSQPEELERTTSAHYCCYNLQGWINLAILASRKGIDLWNYQTPKGANLEQAVHWLVAHQGKEWPYQQIDAFDTDRYYPIKLNELLVKEQAGGDQQKLEVKPVFDPHDGIRPFWQI